MDSIEELTNGFRQEPKKPVSFSWWSQIVPFFLSAVFYLSFFLSIFAPLPILLMGARKGRKWAWFVALTNSVIVALTGDLFGFGCFLVFVVVLALSLLELLQRRKSLEKSVVMTLIGVGIAGCLFTAFYAHFYHLEPLEELRLKISKSVDYLSQSVSTNSSLMNPSEAEEWKRSLFVEFPSALAIFALVLVWSNLVLLIKSSVQGVRESLGLDPAILKRWKAPEYLVWPTLLSGAFLVVDFGVTSDIALNVFKFLMAIYAIQGLSILGFFFDLWGIRGVFRWVGFSLALYPMLPLILSLGFFDLWFDFRSKFRQS